MCHVTTSSQDCSHVRRYCLLKIISIYWQYLTFLGFTSHGEFCWTDNKLNKDNVNPPMHSSLPLLVFYLPLSLSCPIMCLCSGTHVCVDVTGRGSHTDNTDAVLGGKNSTFGDTATFHFSHERTTRYTSYHSLFMVFFSTLSAATCDSSLSERARQHITLRVFSAGPSLGSRQWDREKKGYSISRRYSTVTFTVRRER